MITSMTPEGRGMVEGEREDGVRFQSPSMRSCQRCGLQLIYLIYLICDIFDIFDVSNLFNIFDIVNIFPPK